MTQELCYARQGERIQLTQAIQRSPEHGTMTTLPEGTRGTITKDTWSEVIRVRLDDGRVFGIFWDEMKILR